MTRKEAERVRLRQDLERLRQHVRAVEIATDRNEPIGIDVAEGLMSATLAAVIRISKFDAFDLAEQDAKGKGPL